MIRFASSAGVSAFIFAATAIGMAGRACAGDLVPDDIPILQSCEAALADRLAIRKVVKYPTVYTADCPGGGIGDTSASISVNLPKAWFVQTAGLGNPANWVIEGADMERVEDSGGPGFSGPSFNADVVSGGASCSHGSFGGGVTARFRLIAKLRDVMNDDRARNIARSCVALAFHPGIPR